MNKQTKKILLTTFIIALIIINLSSLATIYYNKKVRDKKIEEFRYKKEQMHVGGMHRFIKNELNLDSSQFEQFRNAYYKNMEESRVIANELKNCRVEILNEVAKKNPDQEKLDKLSRDIGDLHYELKKVSTKHFLELKQICNSEQQYDLQRLFMRMLEGPDEGRNRDRKNWEQRNRDNRNWDGRNRNRDRNHDFN